MDIRTEPLNTNRWGIVYVPMAGVRKKHRRWHQIKEYLELKKVPYDYIQSEDYGAVERLTRMYVENGYKTIVIVGGDMAVNDALNGIMTSSVESLEEISFGIIANGIGNDFADDRTRVVFNEKSSLDYEMACDASKFETDGALQIYTMKGSVRYAINERPKANGSGNIGYTAVEGGYYTIEAARMDTQVFLYDAETETKHNLADGAYRFYTDAGTFEKRFSLGMRDDETTVITEAQLAEAVVAVDGGISFAANVNAVVYNAAGAQVAAQQGEGMVYLPAGTYVVCVGEVNTKVVVK